MSDRGELVRALVSHLRPLVLNSARVVEAGVRHVGWTVAGRAVVALLASDGPATVPVMARRLDLPRQAVQRQVDDLVALAHVEPQPNPDHRRSVLLRLTPAGRRAWDEVAATELAQMGRLALQLSEGDLRTAVAVLAALDEDLRDLARTRGPAVTGATARGRRREGTDR